MKNYLEKNILHDLTNAESKKEIRKILIKNKYIKSFSFKHFANIYVKKLTINNEKFNHIIVIAFTNLTEIIKNIDTINELKKKNALVTIIAYSKTFVEDLKEHNFTNYDQNLCSILLSTLENTQIENPVLYSKHNPIIHLIDAKFDYKSPQKFKFKKIVIRGEDIFEAVFEIILEIIFGIFENL